MFQSRESLTTFLQASVFDSTYETNSTFSSFFTFQSEKGLFKFKMIILVYKVETIISLRSLSLFLTFYYAL